MAQGGALLARWQTTPGSQTRPNGSMTRETLVIRNPGYRRHGSNHKKSGPCFFTKSVKFGFGELSIGRICAESRDLGPEHGFRACSFKNKRKKLDFHTFWDQKTEKNGKVVRNSSKLGPQSSKPVQKNAEDRRG